MLKKIRFELKQGQGKYFLLPVEFLSEDIPFEVKRTYFIISENEQTQTGQHAHFEEKEVFLVIKGSAELASLDEKGGEYTVSLQAGEAVYVPQKIWHGFSKLEPNTVICAFSSTHFKSDRSDYLEDKKEYVRQFIVS